MPLKTGEQAPDFTLYDQHSNPFNLSATLQNGPVVLFFYPKDDSPGCTRQACSFRDSYERLTEEGLTVAGISRDNVDSHNSFKQKHELPYFLLADPDGSVHRMYDCLTLMGLLTRRITFFISSDQKILLAHEDNFRMESHADAILEYLNQ